MSMHKIFKEIFELSNEDTYLLEDLGRIMREARGEFKNVGVEFTYDSFKQWFQRVNGPFPAPTSPTPTVTQRSYDKMWKIIEGDNLDIIEEAAKNRGLI